MGKRHKQAPIKGSLSEIIVMLKFLQNDFTITLESPKIREGIDFFVVNKNGKTFPVEIKSRPSPEEGENVRIEKEKFYQNLIIVIYAWKSGDMWILPSSIYKQYCNKRSKKLYIIDLSKVKKEIEDYKVPKGYNKLKKIISV